MSYLRSTLIAFLALTHIVLSAPLAESKSIAILVGVDKYERRGFSDLKCAENDVRKLSTELKSLGFQTTLLTGSHSGTSRATRANILAKLDSTLRNVKKDDIVLVSLAGHGLQADAFRVGQGTKNDAFYCPCDAVMGEPKTMLSLSFLIDDILKKRGGRNIVLVDACRNTPDDPGRGGIDGKSITLPEDTAVFFSCRAGQQSFEDTKKLKHGLFTYAVLKAVRDATATGGAVRWYDIVSRITSNFSLPEIAKAIPAHRIQEPHLASNMADFVLAQLEKRSGRPTVVAEKINNSIFNTVKQEPVYFSKGGRDMTGFWNGAYYYPAYANRNPVPFSIYFIQQGDDIRGFLREPNTFGKSKHPWLYATIEGNVNSVNGVLSFKKTYDGTAKVSHSVRYRGTVTKDGDKLMGGKWTIPNEWGGKVQLERTSFGTKGKHSGIWNGTYYYRNDNGTLQPVNFELMLVQDGNEFVGFIREPNTFGDHNVGYLYATVTGTIDPRTNKITFTKKYDGTGSVNHDVHYSGTISNDGSKVKSGNWMITSNWTGSFTLHKFSD